MTKELLNLYGFAFGYERRILITCRFLTRERNISRFAGKHFLYRMVHLLSNSAAYHEKVNFGLKSNQFKHQLILQRHAAEFDDRYTVG
jgi:hypothetical protein